ncbi:MAG TPA: helicase C-terminal domain-containing protein [Dehalococcoidia bacterium]|nr:helicase C-terminal domain-containing protein [Dehalococcoidia bacterium]
MAQEYVALDLETTGLDINQDGIIEIGAVRFTRDGVLGTYTTLVRPTREVPDVVLSLTGLNPDELRSAPPLEAVASETERFMEGAILVGQNIVRFDVPILDRDGIRRPHSLYDTADLSHILLPGLGQWSLGALAEHFGVTFELRHRALADAEAARGVFLGLIERAFELPEEVLAQVAQWLVPTLHPWRGFFRDCWDEASRRPPVNRPVLRQSADADAKPLRARTVPEPVASGHSLAVLARASERADLFPQYDRRPQQEAMTEAVATAFNEESRLMVEAGTGTGKSLAYVIPAACHALANQGRVAVSTSTINLQEQLTKKDLPAVQALLPQSGLRATQLKGRRNYLCLKRFNALRTTATLSDEEAFLASKILVWLGETETGDRGELRLTQEEDALWGKLSADGAMCSSDNSPFVVDGTCFMLRARRRAEAAHIVVVNHALLLSDVGTGGRVVPPYEHLIVDEAHNLEDEATRQFGFSCREKELHALLDTCEETVPSLEKAMKSSQILRDARAELAALASALRESANSARPRVRQLADVLKAFLVQQAPPTSDRDACLHITKAMRVQPDWDDVEIAWENCRLALTDVASHLGKMLDGLNDAEDIGMLNQEIIVAGVQQALEEVGGFVQGLGLGLTEDDPGRVVWIETDRGEGGIIVSWVPLVVDGLLREGLYEGRRTVVLTGATLRTQNSFAYLQRRLGLEDCETLSLGSPFDFPRQALVIVPRDIPDPGSTGYLDALTRAIVDAARASEGRALALFTSHSTLRAAHWMISDVLKRDGIEVLGQGIDGSPRQLVRQLRSNARTVVLGTSSFWEGVDIPGEALSLLIMARLPFAVPTDPIFAARSALYEDPFNEYALPQAVIRFKQGFGRLIRTKTDKGVLVVLDQRLITKQYGPAFLQSLPPGTPVRQTALREMPGQIAEWLGARTTAQ